MKKILGIDIDKIVYNDFSLYPDKHSTFVLNGKTYTMSNRYYHGQYCDYKSGTLRALLDYAKKNKNNKNNYINARKALGIVLHAVQDSYAHATGLNTAYLDTGNIKVYKLKKGQSINNFEKHFKEAYKDNGKLLYKLKTRNARGKHHMLLLDNVYADRDKNNEWYYNSGGYKTNNRIKSSISITVTILNKFR